MSKILLVDDDHVLVDMFRDYLVQDGFDVQTACSGEMALDALAQQSFDLLVLDVMMPGIGGIETLRRLRTNNSIPVLMLTARGDDMDRILGLELGADDYVPKPCLPRELAARIRAILRRSAHAHETLPGLPTAIEVGDLCVKPAQRRVEQRGRVLDLTSTEYNLVELLAKHAGQPVSKAQLSDGALGRPLAKFDRSVDVHLHSIRQKMGAMSDGRAYIETVYRLGYQMVLPE